ncbi:MAG TPA: hypothetical protein VKV23_10365 [Acidimicrobiales bacterium]|nr:hypothetical protein [Acidimicrobiales bacterium]
MSGGRPADGEGAAPLAPPPDVLAAIELAVERCWARAEPTRARQPGWEPKARYRWRLSARPWSGPPHLRRDRPWR